ncbi:hypothetical protein D7V80_11760 [Corallococcus sp. CA054B]|uniref:hypothetical protein n=1 Tax=Corallococcus sp. CA054B TaxID=2316734 RepID=UPI000EA1DB8D|nr:hypothetical protein [Corallococcus sp. CA054B]RKG68666.1 hypothetical protein D7V80_11760 [Corallococcus sp. CA054B]
MSTHQFPGPLRFAAALLFCLTLVHCGPSEDLDDSPPTRPPVSQDGGPSDGGASQVDSGMPTQDGGSTPRDGGGGPICTPSCSGRSCGPDGCGGTCGTCRSGTTCSGGSCVCVPQCNGKTCGPDGCGGVCGTCPANATCSTAGDSCACVLGYVPNQAHNGCVRVGGACEGVSQYGYCSGDTWVRCDAQEGIVTMECGPGQCKRLDSAGNGACTCGSIDANGVCATASGASAATPRVHFICAPSAGVLIASNCTVETGSSAGFCSTFVTSFGHQTTCFCGTCSVPGRNNQCGSLCGNPAQCQYSASGNFHTCGF